MCNYSVHVRHFCTAFGSSVMGFPNSTTQVRKRKKMSAAMACSPSIWLRARLTHSRWAKSSLASSDGGNWRNKLFSRLSSRSRDMDASRFTSAWSCRRFDAKLSTCTFRSRCYTIAHGYSKKKGPVSLSRKHIYTKICICRPRYHFFRQGLDCISRKVQIAQVRDGGQRNNGRLNLIS